MQSLNENLNLFMVKGANHSHNVILHLFPFFPMVVGFGLIEV